MCATWVTWSSVTVVKCSIVFVEAVVAVSGRSQEVSFSSVLFGNIQSPRQSKKSTQKRRSCLGGFAPVDTKCCSSIPCREYRNELLRAPNREYVARVGIPSQFRMQCRWQRIYRQIGRATTEANSDSRLGQRLQRRLSTAGLSR